MLTTFSLHAEDYSLSSHMATHEKDGEQQFQLSYLAWARLTILQEHLTTVFPKTNFHSFTYIPLGVGVVTSFAAPYAKKYLKSEGEKQPVLTTLCQVVVKIGDAGKELCQNSRNLINVTCCVSYVAMITFGHPVAGSIGLASVALLCLKREGYLKGWIEQSIDPIVFLASSYAVWSMPINGVVRAGMMYDKVSEGLDLLKRYETTQRFLPECILRPNPGVHKKSDLLELAEAKKEATEELNVEFSHIYNRQVSKLLPEDVQKEVDAKSVTELFDGLIKRFIDAYKSDKEATLLTLEGLRESESEKVTEMNTTTLMNRFFINGDANERAELYDLLSPEKAKELKEIFNKKPKSDTLEASSPEEKTRIFAQQQTSWKQRLIDAIDAQSEPKLKEAAKIIETDRLTSLIDGFKKLRTGVEFDQFEDERPKDFTLFQRTVKEQMASMLVEKDPSNFIADFKEMCRRGLTCSESWMEEFSPEAPLNTSDLEWAIHRRLSTMRGAIVEEKLNAIRNSMDLSIYGGNANVHVSNALQCAVYTRFRTLKGEKYHQVNPREMFETIWLLLMNKGNDREWGWGDTAFLAHEVTHVHPLLLLSALELTEHFRDLDKEYTTERIVERVRNSFLPLAGSVPAIRWDVVETWLNKRVGDESEWGDLVEKVSVNEQEYTCLTGKGVRLLLLDLGILAPKDFDEATYIDV